MKIHEIIVESELDDGTIYKYPWDESKRLLSKIGFELRSLVMQKTWFSMEHSVRIHTTNVALQKEINSAPQVLISSSKVSFEVLSLDQIHAYVASGEHLGKAGAYGIQGLAACFIKHIEGSFSGIMGLPVFETAQIIQDAVKYKLN